MTTSRNKDMGCCITLTRYFNRMRVNKSCILVYTFNAIAIKTTLIRTMDTIDISLTIGLKRCKIKLINCHIKTILACITVKGFSNLSTIPHDLFRHTTYIDTGTTDLFSFKENNLSTMHGSTIGTGNTTRTTTNDNIIVFFYHILPLMFLYTAYWLLDKPFLPILYHKIGTLTKICYDTKNNPVTTRLFCHILFIKWFAEESEEDT